MATKTESRNRTIECEQERSMVDSRKATNEMGARTRKVFFVRLIKSSIEDHSCQFNRTLIDRNYRMSGLIMNTDQCNRNLAGFDRLELSSVNYYCSRAMRDILHCSPGILLECNTSRLDNRFFNQKNLRRRLVPNETRVSGRENMQLSNEPNFIDVGTTLVV